MSADSDEQFVSLCLRARILQLEEEMKGFIRWQNDIDTDQRSVNEGRDQLARELTAIQTFMKEHGL